MLYLLVILLSFVFASASFANAPHDSIYTYTDTSKIIRGKYKTDFRISSLNNEIKAKITSYIVIERYRNNIEHIKYYFDLDYSAESLFIKPIKTGELFIRSENEHRKPPFKVEIVL